jgi:hypothetical protein
MFGLMVALGFGLIWGPQAAGVVILLFAAITLISHFVRF